MSVEYQKAIEVVKKFNDEYEIGLTENVIKDFVQMCILHTRSPNEIGDYMENLIIHSSFENF